MTDPTLNDDERALAEYASALVEAVSQILPGWLRSLVDRRARGLASQPAIQAQLDQAAAETVVELRELLAADIADQRSGPLEVLRRAVRFPTEVLAAADVPAVTRDDFAIRNFPDDVYNLTPASFADVDPSLHEPGLVWGAAKAHVHLRRRRDQTAPTGPPSQPAGPAIVALTADLMDRSKISAAFPDAAIVRSLEKLGATGADASLVIVDLARVPDPTVLRNLVLGDAIVGQFSGRIVGFGSHVNDDVLAAADAAGIEALPRSVFFRRLQNGDL